MSETTALKHDIERHIKICSEQANEINQLTKENEELETDKAAMSKSNCDFCDKADGGVSGICEGCMELSDQGNATLKSRIKELGAQLKWKPAIEAVVGHEYDVCGGKYILRDDHSCYSEWFDMDNMVRVSTYKGIEFGGPDFEGEYGECYNSEYHYLPKWIRERPTPPTPEGDK